MPIRKPVKNRALLVEYDIPRDKSLHHAQIEGMVRNAVTAAIHAHVRKAFSDDPVSQIPLDTLKVNPLPCSAEHFRWLASYVQTGDADLDREDFLRSIHARLHEDVVLGRPLGMGETKR